MTRPLLATLLRAVTGVRLHPAPPHQGEAAIFYANHTSHLDFALLWATLPAAVRDRTSPVAAEDYWDRPGLRRWLASRVFQAVLIPREGITKENHPLERIGAVLEAGRSVIIFPEGTRSRDGRTGAFKSGLYHLARRFPAIPLVPVHLENLNRIMPKGTFLPVPLIARVSYRVPVTIHDGEEKSAFLGRARDALLGGAAPAPDQP